MRTVETIGNATLYLGDCREILPTLGRVDAVVTDPPYGTGFDFGAMNRPKTAKQKDGNRWGQDWGRMEGDNQPFDPKPWTQMRAVLWGAHYFCDDLKRGNVWLVWDKGVPEGMASSSCELAWTSIPGGGVRKIDILWSGFRRETEIREHHHPTQKPVRLMEWCITQLKLPVTSTILDPYMGSGTTGIAAHRLGHRFIGVECDPRHFATAVTRLRREVDQGVLPFNGPAIAEHKSRL